MGMTDGEIERAFSIQGEASLSVRGDAGDVQISAWDDSIIRVSAEGGEPSFAATENSVAVQPGSGHGAIDYEIRVPRECAVQVNSSNGDITIEGTTRDVTIKSQAGDVNLLHLSGACLVTTANGDLDAEDLRGSLKFSTSSGDLTVESSALTGFDVETVNGDAEIETSLAREGSYRFNTVGGDLELAIPRGTGATIHMQTQQGDMQSELPAEITHVSGTRWEGTINGGGARVDLQSVSGDLQIEESDSLPPQSVPSRQPVPVTTESSRFGDEPARGVSAESTTILEMLARGEIDVDEAMVELEHIEI